MSGPRIEAGQVVTFTYSVKDQDGQLIELNDLPVSYLHGSDSDLLPILERHLEGHQAGDEVEVEVPPDEGFGQRDPDLTFTDDLANVPQEFQHVGAQVEMHNDLGEVKTFTVSRIADGRLTADANHPFAGRTVIFILRIQEVRPATEQELEQGVISQAEPH